MAQHYEVRILPNGHPMIYIPTVPPYPPPPTTLPGVSPTPPVTTPLPPQPLPTPIAPVPHQLPHQNLIVPGLVPMEQLLNPNGLPLPQPIGLGGPNPLLDMFQMQYPLLTPGLNPYISPLGLPFVQINHNHPPPLMSLRVPTPPSMRMHPYQREAMHRRQRHRTNSHRTASRNQNNVAPAVNQRPPNEQEARASTIRHTNELDEERNRQRS